MLGRCTETALITGVIYPIWGHAIIHSEQYSTVKSQERDHAPLLQAKLPLGLMGICLSDKNTQPCKHYSHLSIVREVAASNLL